MSYTFDPETDLFGGGPDLNPETGVLKSESAKSVQKVTIKGKIGKCPTVGEMSLKASTSKGPPYSEC